MKNTLALFCLLMASIGCYADGYAGLGLGYTEACRTPSEPSFSGGDCIEPNFALRGILGYEFNEYFSIESTLDAAFDGGHVINFFLDAISSNNSNEVIIVDGQYTNRWSITSLGAGAYLHLPLSHSFRLFAGPTVGASIVSIDYDVKYFGNGDSRGGAATEAGLNHGWSAGAEYFSDRNNVVRLQWQNMRSLDADSVNNKKFNTNTFTVNFISYF